MPDKRVVFEEGNDLIISPARPEPKGFATSLLKNRIVSAPGDAAIVLTIFAIILVAGSFYLLTSSIREPVMLGEDVLRPGEQIPEYRRGP